MTDKISSGFAHPKETLLATVFDIWEHFLRHVPLLLIALVVLLVTFGSSRVLRNAMRRVLRGRKFRDSLKELILRFTAIFVWMLGLLIAAMIVFPGLTPTRVLGGLGILSVALGFAFKDIFENFFAGVLILWRFPFENGDFIEVNDIEGRVLNTSIRVTLIRKTNNELIIVPNSMLLKNPVRVLTDKELRRFDLAVGVAYDQDVRVACLAIERALRRCKKVDQDMGFQVFPRKFASSGVEIEVCWWGESTPFGNRDSRAEVVMEIKETFDRNGIEIPFEYRTLVFKEPIKVENV